MHSSGVLRRLRVPDEAGGDWRLDDYLEHTRTAAFVVVHEDRIVMERYARGYDRRSRLNSFSIAKAVIAALVGIAVADGHIASLDATVAAYCPEFASTPYGAVTLHELLTMTSGIGDASLLLRAVYYYGDDLHATTAAAQPRGGPAGSWRYSEGDVQTLAFVLEAATGKSVSAYLAEKIWAPLGIPTTATCSNTCGGCPMAGKATTTPMATTASICT